jgi:hypothetical protein
MSGLEAEESTASGNQVDLTHLIVLSKPTIQTTLNRLIFPSSPQIKWI